MAEDLYALLLKALRMLPADEQDDVLRALLERQVSGMPFAGRLPLTAAAAATHAGHIPWLGVGRSEPRAGALRVVPVRLSAEQHDELKQWCESNDFSMAVVIRGLVDRFLASQRAT